MGGVTWKSVTHFADMVNDTCLGKMELALSSSDLIKQTF